MAYLSLCLCIGSSNYVIIAVIAKEAGDINYCFVADLGILWLVRIPYAFISANVFHQPIMIVYLAVLLESFIKLILMFFLFRSGRWKHQVSVEEIWDKPYIIFGGEFYAEGCCCW